jgi:hypothetical protein
VDSIRRLRFASLIIVAESQAFDEAKPVRVIERTSGLMFASQHNARNSLSINRIDSTIGASTIVVDPSSILARSRFSPFEP